GRGIAFTRGLGAVCAPRACSPGIRGQFFNQSPLPTPAPPAISAINAMPMAPARAVTLIRPHADGGHGREALPRLGFALLAGLAAYFLLVPPLAARLGLAAGDHHGGPEGGPAAPWAPKAGPLLAAG